MAVSEVSGAPALVFSGEGHVRTAGAADAAAVVLGHEAGNLLNFAAIAAARGGYVVDEHLSVRLGFVDGELTVVGGTSSAVIVAPDPYAIPYGNAATDVAQPAPAAAAVPQQQQQGVQTNVDLRSAGGSAPTPAPPPETTNLQSTAISANLNLVPQQFPSALAQRQAPNNIGTAETTLAATRQEFALAADQGKTQGSYLFATNVFIERGNFQYEPFAGLGRDPIKPFGSTEIPRIFVDGAY